MKTLWMAIIAMFVFCMLSACGQAAPRSISPGAHIGDFLITTGKVEEVKFMYELDESDLPSDETEIEVPWGTKVVTTYGIYDDSYSGKLDETWSTLVYTLEINGRPVNLEAFGTIEKRHHIVGTMRHYNVVIEAVKPGKISVHHAGKVGDDSFDETYTMIFLPPGDKSP
jgi:hypothetical protein